MSERIDGSKRTVTSRLRRAVDVISAVLVPVSFDLPDPGADPADPQGSGRTSGPAKAPPDRHALVTGTAQLGPAYATTLLGLGAYVLTVRSWAVPSHLAIWAVVEGVLCAVLTGFTLWLRGAGTGVGRRTLKQLNRAHGFVWAAPPVFFSDRHQMLPWLITIMFVVAYVGAGAILFASAPSFHRAFSTPAQIGLALWIVVTNPDLLALAGALLVYALMMDRYNNLAAAMLLRALDGEQRNRTLVDRLRSTEALSSSIVETAAEAIFSVRPDGVIERANAAADALAAADTELEGRPITSLLPAFVLRDEDDDLRGEEMLLRGDDGSLREVLVSTSRVERTDLVTLIARDIADRKQLERRLEHEASHDQLTGLLNRSAMLVCAEHAARRARAHGRGFGMLFVDLDRFKHVNDGLGHGFGDKVLQLIAERLVEVVGSFDDVARMGGDEFVVLLEHFESVHDAVAFGEEICRRLEGRYQIGGHEPFISASIGLAWSADATADPRELIKRADMAMYRAKAGGRRRLTVFDQDMQDRADEHSVLEWALRRAVDDGDLHVEGQPIVDRAGRLRGVELLARWEHPIFGRVPPVTFIPIAEESGLVVDIGRWVLGEACQLLQQWSGDEQTSGLFVSVNISGLHLQGDLVADVAHALRRGGFDPGRLAIEVTETHLMSDLGTHRGVLQSVRDLGVGIALDDFGTGYSSLAYFATLPATGIKVDKSFVAGIVDDEHARAIVNAVSTLARSFGRSVVVEGIETPEQWQQAIALGADRFQGYLFGRPGRIGTSSPELLLTASNRP